MNQIKEILIPLCKFNCYNFFLSSEKLSELRRICDPSRHGHDGVHGLCPLLHVREPGQANHPHRLAGNDNNNNVHSSKCKKSTRRCVFLHRRISHSSGAHLRNEKRRQRQPAGGAADRRPVCHPGGEAMETSRAC